MILCVNEFQNNRTAYSQAIASTKPCHDEKYLIRYHILYVLGLIMVVQWHTLSSSSFMSSNFSSMFSKVQSPSSTLPFLILHPEVYMSTVALFLCNENIYEIIHGFMFGFIQCQTNTAWFFIHAQYIMQWLHRPTSFFSMAMQSNLGYQRFLKRTHVVVHCAMCIVVHSLRSVHYVQRSMYAVHITTLNHNQMY